MVTGIRWATLAAGLAIAAARSEIDGAVLGWGLLILGHAVWRTVRSGRRPTQTAVLIEIAINAAAVMATGFWGSPFVFSLMTGVVLAGFAVGFAFALEAATAAFASVSFPYLIAEPSLAGVQTAGQWMMELALVAVLAGYARRLFGEAQAQQSLALDRVSQLTEANDLLVSLHRVAQALPASLNLTDVLASSVERLRGLIDCDVLAVLLRDETSSGWTVGVSEGARVAQTMSDEELPAPLRAAASSSVASLVVCLQPNEGLGIDLLARAGLYAPLRARGELVGLVALEHPDPGRYGRRELQLLDGFIDHAALAIDNARWFARLRTMGADEERTRIARDMHDQVGQSLASVAFKLDSLTKRCPDGQLATELDSLRGEVRGVLVDVRNTLSDLRTDVSDQRGVADVLAAFVARVGERSTLDARLDVDGNGRLQLVQERELWCIALEAITNAERHSGADHLSVRWECDGAHALLRVADDGHGFELGRHGRADSYGIMGMRERADAIGATLDIRSGPNGTTVCCRLKGLR
ncbi:MAG TPA: GAF domain-containing sensor histidine kinase [Acidimicrobiales bacterium]|nr:GAF domain-containing sensor histidine kinase [Acidimicrobiales bacterium]